MRILNYLSIVALVLLLTPMSQARDFVGAPNTSGLNGGGENTSVDNGQRASCIESKAQTDLDINNVRARLLAGGDMWWDANGTARYIVPNVDPASGEPEVSSLFAGAIWLGGYDDGGNLILAAQTYRSSGNDYWNGPLDPLTGTIEKSDCERWDRHFEVSGADIDALRADFLEVDPGLGTSDFTIDITPSNGLLGWPGRGNPHFVGIYGFELPDQDLAPFVDFNGDGVYNPYDGDHPVIEVAGCPTDYFNPVYADQMIWWVYNDNGNIHTQTNGQPMVMEVQVTAFGYRTTDAINNMTFYRYKLLNRNALTLNDVYFSLWSDPDLGCFDDDMIGCDTLTGMGYVYNADNNDDATCGANGGLGYGTTIPALAVDYFRGPLDSAGVELGLSSFQYHVNDASPIGDPNAALGYYRLISGVWPDGTPITGTGTGYNPGSTDPSIEYVFPSWPDETDPDSWSMCFGGNTSGADFRFLHTSGPFVLKPGATNEMISGVVWVPEIPDYPCPSLNELVAADELAQNLFDDCFKITDGPDAPFIDIIEMNNELVLNLSYTPAQNNFELAYEESPSILEGTADTTYTFQGYKVYQVENANVSVTELDDPEVARLIFQCDIQDSVSKVINWTAFPDEDVPNVFIPEIMVEGENNGIQHTFRVTEDKFASDVDKLVNHKPYYFCVVAYGYNEYEPYSPQSNSGQALPYLQGRRNFRIYTGVPRDNSPEYYGAVLNSAYGDRPEITRLDGRGNGGGLFLDVEDRAAFEDELFANGKVGEVTYVENGGPVDVKIVDPLRVAPGTYRLYICDEDFVWNNNSGSYSPAPPAGITELGNEVYWSLTNVDNATDYWTSYQTIDFKAEQYIPELGISLSIRQASEPGIDGTSGFIGSTMEYTDTEAIPWYAAIEDEATGILNVLKTGNAQADQELDPTESYSLSAGGWYPALLTDCRYLAAEFYFSPNDIGGSYCSTPSLTSNWRTTNLKDVLGNQRNVNVVITPNKDLWSRCVVVETANQYHTDALGLTIPSNRTQSEWKSDAPSVDKDGNVDPTAPTGFSWFPGYAYDIETGERLNIFFGENSFFDGSFYTEQDVPGSTNGNDMIYNPTSTVQATPPSGFIFGEENQYLASVYGGHHYIYVSNSVYDECETVKNLFSFPVPPLQDDAIYHLYTAGTEGNPAVEGGVIWASMSYMLEGTSMQGENENIPPSEVVFKLRVETEYDMFNATGVNNNYPLYEFSLDKYAPTKQSDSTATSALDLINIVPNPYYAYSDYEVTEIDNVIKIVNLPPSCTVEIFSLEGRLVRNYSVAQQYPGEARSGIARIGLYGSSDVEDQIVTSIEWDLKNNAGVPVGSGVYLVRVVAQDETGAAYGERVLKSFIINRAFDPQKL